MAYQVSSHALGVQAIPTLDTVGPGPNTGGAGTGAGPTGLVGAFDSIYTQELQAYDLALGGGAFVYLRYSGTITVGTICEITPTQVSGVVVNSATAWAGTVNTGKPLCVAMATTGAVGQWGWFQIQGNAVCTVQGTPAAGNSVYWQATGVVSPTPVASKQMLNAQFATGVSQTIGAGTTAVVLTSTQAVVTLSRPFAQGAIT